MRLDDRLRGAADEAAGLFNDEKVPAFSRPPRRGLIPAVGLAGLVAAAIIVAAGVRSGPEPDRTGVVTTTAPVTSTTIGSQDGALVLPRPIDGGSSVIDVILGDGSRFAVVVPTSIVDGPVEVTTVATSAELLGDSLDAGLSLRFCSEVLDFTEVNARGAEVATRDDELVVCRPDQMVMMRFTGGAAYAPDDVDRFDIVPVAIGEQYAAALDRGGLWWIDDFGPLRVGDAVIAAGRYSSGTVVSWDEETLVPRWSMSIGDSSILLGVAGERVLATPGTGSVVGLSLATGEVEWRTVIPDGLTVVGAAPDGTRPVWYVSVDEETEGATGPPRLLAIDVDAGTLLWDAEGEAATLLQWSDPVVIDGVVAMLDVPRYTDPDVSPGSGHVVGFDAASGERLWAAEVVGGSGFSDGLLAADPARDLLIAVGPGGAVTSIDPATGDVRWVTDLGFSRIVALETDTVLLVEGAEEVRLDLATGEVVGDDGETAALPVVSPLDVERSVALRILTISPRRLESAVIDLEAAAMTLYTAESDALRARAEGAVMTPNRELVVWTYEPAAYVFSGDLTRADLEMNPETDPDASWAPALRVVPTPDGNALWVVQPGAAYGDIDVPTLVELVELPTGRSLTSFEVEPNAFPIGATNAGLVLNMERLMDTGDGWITEPGSEHVVIVDAAGVITDVGPGRALAASAGTTVRLVCAAEDQSDCELVIGDRTGAVARPGDGEWAPVGEPEIPNSTMPLQLISPDGTSLLVGFDEDPDVNGTPARSTLYVVDLADGSSRRIATFENRYPQATWSADGAWIAAIAGRDVMLYATDDPAVTFTVHDAIPEDHYAFAAG